MNSLRPNRLKSFLDATGTEDGSEAPNVWLTEQGGLLYYEGCKAVKQGNDGQDRQQKAVRYMVGYPDAPYEEEGLVNRFRDRISRFYYYSWRATRLVDCAGTREVVEQRGDFDSGLVTPKREGASPRVRTAYYCYRFKTNPQDGDREKCRDTDTQP